MSLFASTKAGAVLFSGLVNLESWHAESSVLAFITTIHLALVVLRVHRSRLSGPFNFVTLVSVLFAASPFLMPSIEGLVTGFVAHLVWFGACEYLLPTATLDAAAGRPTAAAVPAPRPRVPVTRPVAGPAPASRSAEPPPARQNNFVLCPVLNVIAETPDIRTFRFARPEGIEFSAGQFIAVRVRAEGKEHVRCYSVSSAPATRGYLEISVKRIGLVSGTLHATMRPGSMLAVKAPAGAFAYPSGEDRPLVLIAGGVGITPLVSMLRHAVDTEPTRPVSLFYSVKTEADVAFREELTWLANRHPQVQVILAVTGEAPPSGMFSGRISDTLLRTTVPDIADASCFLCGPPPMIDRMTGLLGELGVPRPQIHFEVFNPAVAVAAGLPPENQGAADQGPAPSAGYDATFERTGVTARVPGTQTLLEAAEGSGAPIPSLCRAGVCGTCRTRVLAGDVDCQSSLLDDQDRIDGYVLACVSHVRDDCRVDA